MKLANTIFIILISTFILFAQETDSKAKQLEAKLNSGSITSETYKAILEAGKSGDKSFIPYLKTLASRETTTDYDTALHTIKSYAQIALATLGDEEYLNKFIRDVDSENIFLQDLAMHKLAMVNNKSTYKTFYRLLDDTKYRQEVPTDAELQAAKEGGYHLRKGDELLVPRSFMVMRILSKMVTNPPTCPNLNEKESDIKLWKKWFEEHKELIE
jgi:HEAT repeat protein